jgi:RimJ/RimL family protein N-acetyltransferase
MPLPTPTLQTPRLLLRPFLETDAEAIYALQSNPRVLRYWDSPPWKDRSRAEAFLSACRQIEEDGSGARFVIETLQAQAFIGWCSMFRWNPTYRSLGIGYCLDEPAWGKGHATEAVQAMLSWAYQALDLNRVEAELDTRNTASARVLEKLGFVREGARREDCVVDGEVSDSWIYGLLKREWAADPTVVRARSEASYLPEARVGSRENRQVDQAGRDDAGEA